MVTLADLGVLRDVRVEDDGTVVVEITPTYTGCPAMGVMRADLVHALHRRRVRRRRRPHRPLPRLDHRLDQRGRPPQAGRRRHRAARRGAGPLAGPGAAEPRPDPPHGGLPALRLDRHRGAVGVRGDRLQGAAPLPQRAASPSSTSRRSDERPRAATSAVPPADRREGRAAHRRRRRRHLRHPRRAGRGLPLQARPGTDPAPGRRRPRRAPLVLDLRADGRPAAGRRPRGARRLLLLLPGAPGAARRHDRGAAAVGHVHRRPVRAGRPRLRRRRVGHHARCCRWPAPCCGTASRPSPSSTATGAPTRSCSPTSSPT